MKIAVCASALITASISIAPASAQRSEGVGEIITAPDRIEISGAGHTRTIPCQGRPVEIAGSDHDIRLTGICRSLDVSGSENRVELGIAPRGKLVVAGSQHVVRWQSAGEPAMDISGADHDIKRIRPSK